MVLLGLLIFSLVATQTRRETLTDETAQASLYSFADAYAERHPNHNITHSSAAKTAGFPWRDKYITLFDLLEPILNPRLSPAKSQNFVGAIEKEPSKSGEITK
jgi:hypothetical protein